MIQKNKNKNKSKRIFKQKMKWPSLIEEYKKFVTRSNKNFVQMFIMLQSIELDYINVGKIPSQNFQLYLQKIIVFNLFQL